MAQVFYFVAAAATLSGGRKAAKAQAQQAAYEQQRARQEYLQYRQEGVAVLDEMLQNAATMNAYAGAGGIDAASGSADTIANFNLAQGVTDLVTAREAGEMSLMGGRMRAEQLMAQAKATKLNAFAQAAGMAAAGFEAAGATSTGGGGGGGVGSGKPGYNRKIVS